MSNVESPRPHRSSFWIKTLLVVLILLAVAAGLWWWLTRPIQPVVLSPTEKAVVEEKIAVIQSSGSDPTFTPAPAKPSEPTYEKGKKDIILTEREINGLLNANTDLGQSLSFQLGTDVVLARIETDLDPDLPLIGGRKFKARARFLVSEASGQPSFIIDDLTIWGISLPNEWLGGLKGRNLLAELLGSNSNGKVPGIESFTIRPGQLTIKLAE